MRGGWWKLKAAAVNEECARIKSAFVQHILKGGKGCVLTAEARAIHYSIVLHTSARLLITCMTANSSEADCILVNLGHRRGTKGLYTTCVAFAKPIWLNYRKHDQS